MTDTALILIDLQNDYFPGGLKALPKAETAAQNAALLLDWARQQDIPRFHIRHIATSDAAPFFKPGTIGSEIHDSVTPQEDEPTIIKHRPNSFHETTLRDRLNAVGISKLILCGAMSQMCIDATARAAADFGYKVTIASDACAAAEVNLNGETVHAEDVHKAFLGALAGVYGEIVSTDDLIN